MTLELAYEQATLFAEDLPDHTGQLHRYTNAGLSAETALTLEKRAARIQTLGRQTILEIGSELVAARAEAQYGMWGAFLTRCGLEERTAENYMRVVKSFADKPEMISALPATALYALAAPSADPVVVGEIIAEVADGVPPSATEVKQRLAAARPGYTPVQSAPAPTDDAPPYTPSDGTPQVTQVAAHTRTVAAPAPAQPTQLPPALNITPASSMLPPVLSIGQGAVSPTLDVQQRKLQIARLQLLREALAIVEAEVAAVSGAPTIVINQERAEQAAESFLSSPAFGAAAAMLAFSAVVE